MNRRFLTTAATGATVLGLGLGAVVLPATAAGAAPRSGSGSAAAATATASADKIQAAKDDAAQAIAKRQAQLVTLEGRLAASSGCDTGGHVAGVISADQSGLATLGQKIAADTDPATLAADIRSIFTDFRVYLVVTPQADTAAACGHVTTAATTLGGDLASANQLIAVAKAAGRDTAAAEAAAADMATQLDAASGPARDAAASVAALTPDHGDASVAAANAAAVDAAHAQLTGAGKALRAATADLKTIVTQARSW